MNEIWEFVKSIQLTTVTSIVGAIGGALGAFAFLDNYVFKFRPLIIIGNRIFLIFKDDIKKKQFLKDAKILTRIQIKVEIYNKRNRTGTINDFALRIFNSDSINPGGRTFFANSELAAFPDSGSNALSVSKSAFSSLSVLARSSKSVALEFSMDIFDAILAPLRSITLDFYVQYQSGKWRKHSSFSLFLFEKDFEQFGADMIYKYNNLNWSASRETLKPTLDRPESSLYHGITHKYLRPMLLRPYYRFLKRPFFAIFRGFELAYRFPSAFWKYVYHGTVTLPVVLEKGKQTEQFKITMGGQELIAFTDAAMSKMGKTFQNLAQELNEKATSEDAKISVIIQDKRLQLKRDKQTLDVYISGNGYIVAQDQTGPNNRVMFRLKVKKFIWRLHMWQLDETEYLFVKTICIKILDTFVLHSSV